MYKPVPYKTLIHQRRYGDKLYVVEAIRSLDEAIDDLCETLSDEEQKDPFAEDLCPYFGILWPASETLAKFIADSMGTDIKNKTVLELGCGLGLPSMVASHLGAKVLATDYHPDVEFYFKRNLRHSSIECDYQRLNWREDQGSVGQYDIVMGSDVLYENKHAREVAQGLIRFVKPDGMILLSDPGRNYLQPFLEAMKKEGFHEEAYLEQEIFVFKFTKL